MGDKEELHIEKGRGTALKDIPNVAHKLSMKKNEETWKLLHTILFGRRGKASQVKSNISQFSGFVWRANEDKQKNEIKEKLDKCVEEKLLEFCNVLDLPIAKTTARKEDFVTELLEFFEAPQVTSDELLADKEVSSKGNKRKRSSKKSTSNLGAHLQKAQLRVERGMSMHLKARRKRIHVKRTMIKEHEDDDVHGAQENVDSSSDGSEDEKPEHAKSEEKEADTGVESKEATKKRKRVTEAVEESSPIPKKSTSKDIAGKKVLKGNEIKAKGGKLKPCDTELKNATCELLLKELKPSDTELKNATCELLKEVDCKTATIMDILKLLGERFNTDLSPRKSIIWRIILDEIKAEGEKLTPSVSELKNATCELLKELKPSDTELKNATCELLKEVDCKTATIMDIFKLLGERFNTDLVPRKSTIWRMMLDEIKAKQEKLTPSDTELKNATCELLKELKPSDTELKNATCELLKEVDCKTATIMDILKLLGERFNTDLLPRKSIIWRIILDEIKAEGEKLTPSVSELKNATCELLKELKPSDTELKNATCELLKEVDCKTATIMDIFKLLGERFNTDLVPRKSTIWCMILDEIKAKQEKLTPSDTELKNATCELLKELKPSDTELKNATCELLKEVDCKTATIMDIFKLLGERFNTDLVPRKSTIWRMILDEIKAKQEKLTPSDTELKNVTCELLKELKPSDTELKNATCELLKEVHCKTATIMDILKLLGERFNTDLLHRKSIIWRIILDEIKAEEEKLTPSVSELKNATCELLKELKPSDTELKNSTCELLKEVDCKTATIMDIFKLHGERFNTDLLPRKSIIWRIILDEIKAEEEKLTPSVSELKNATCELLKELKPSDTELKNSTCELLKEVDCKTATIMDIFKLLGERFNTDLVPRKLIIWRIILDEIKAKGEKLTPSDSELKNATCELLKELKPSDTELKNATCELLKEVDCKTATIMDIFKLLGERFNTDLFPRKSTIRRIILDEIKAKAGKLTPSDSELKNATCELFKELKPSDTELKNATCELLKEVDCKSATIMDIFKLLVERFNTDLVPRKLIIWRIILDEIKAKGEKLTPSDSELKNATCELLKELKPSDTELKNATCELLKEVDCKTATIMDIFKLLGERFNTDLFPRKSTIRRIILDEIKAKAGKLTPSDSELKNATCELFKELKPSDTELKNATCELLKEVDCKSATIMGILKLLGERFNTDLVPRKSTIRRIILDELTKMF